MKNYQDNSELFELTEVQQKAFDALKKAHKACLRSGIIFYNNYGTLGALNKKLVDRYDDDPTDGIAQMECRNPHEFPLQCNEWSDDDYAHYFHPTTI